MPKGLRKASRDEERALSRPLPLVASEDVQLTDMRPAEYNPRDIDDDAREHLQESIQRFGLVEPIIWNKRTGNIVGGHRRYEYLIERGQTRTHATVVDLDLEEEKVLNITLNNQRAQGHFQSDSLTELLADIQKSVAAIEFDSLGLSALSADFTFTDQSSNGKEDDDEEHEPEPVKTLRGCSISIKFPSKEVAQGFFNVYGLELNGATEVFYEEMELNA